MSPKGEGFISGKLPITEDEGWYICGIHHSSGSYDTYFGNITLGCKVDNLTMKTTYNWVLYFFVDSSAWFALALADLKVTMV